MTRSLSERTALTVSNKNAQEIKKLKNLMEQLEKVADQTSSSGRATTIPCTNLVGTKTHRRKRSRSASHRLLHYRQPPRSTTIGSATSRTATGARTVLPDARSESAEALELWDGNQAAT